MYAQTVAQPARGVTVELLQNGAAIASTTTDATGNYSFGNVAQNVDVSVARARRDAARRGAELGLPRRRQRQRRSVVHARGRRVQHRHRERHAQSACRIRLDGRGLHGHALGGAVRDPRRRLRRRAARVDGRADSPRFPRCASTGARRTCPSSGTAPGEIGSSAVSWPDVGILLRRRRQSGHRRIRPARHRARVRALSRASLLALRQHRRSARAHGPARHAARVRRGVGQRVRGDGHGRNRLRRQRTAPARRTLSASTSSRRPSRINPNPGWFNEESLQSLIFDLYDNGARLPPGSLVVDDVALGLRPDLGRADERAAHDARADERVSVRERAESRAPCGRAADRQLDDVAAHRRPSTTITARGNQLRMPTKRTLLEVAADFNTVYDSRRRRRPRCRTSAASTITRAR